MKKIVVTMFLATSLFSINGYPSIMEKFEAVKSKIAKAGNVVDCLKTHDSEDWEADK